MSLQWRAILATSIVLLVVSALINAVGQSFLEDQYRERRSAIRGHQIQVIDLLLQTTRGRLELVASAAFRGEHDAAVPVDDLRIQTLDDQGGGSHSLLRLLTPGASKLHYGIACDPVCHLWRIPRVALREPPVAVGVHLGAIFRELVTGAAGAPIAVGVSTTTGDGAKLRWLDDARSPELPVRTLEEISAGIRLDEPLADRFIEFSRGATHYEVVTVNPSAFRNIRVLVVLDTTGDRAAISTALERRLWGTAAAMGVLALALLAVLRGPMLRLRRTTEAALPLVARNQFEAAREVIGVHRRGGRFNDEIDHLDDTAMDLSLRLERLQGEVVERTAALQRERDFISRLLDTPQVLILTQDHVGRILRVNQYALRLTGHVWQQFIGQRFVDLMPGSEEVLPQIEDLRQGRGRMVSHESFVPCANGEVREVVWFHSRIDLRVDRDLEPVHDAARPALVSAGIDITDRKRAERRLFEEKERAQVTLQSINDGVVTTDAVGRVDYVNPAAEGMGGISLEKAAGRPFEEVFRLTAEDGTDKGAEVLRSCMDSAAESMHLGELLLHAPDGREYAVSVTTGAMHDRDGAVRGTVLVFRDVSRERNMARKLSYQASHDALTCLVNRREFESRIEIVLDDARTQGSHHVLMFLDLDRFKVVNDTCGHRAGDELLKQLALLLQKSVRAGDCVARLGGDEFGILLQHCQLDRALPIAETARRTVQNHRFAWEGRTFTVGASIGVVRIAQASESLQQVLSAADEACYAAKESGRNRVIVHGHDMEIPAKTSGDPEWGRRIDLALDQERFCLFAQPILPLQTGVMGPTHELLLRMEEDGRLLPPGAFIPPAERYNLMTRLDRWVVREVLSKLPGNVARANGIGSVTINLSAHSLVDKGFQEFVRAEIGASGSDADRLCFEITETAAIGNLTGAMNFMRGMRDLGCKFALDDFGSGLSSFGYLKTLPVDYIKIDGTFVRGIDHDPVDLAMVKSIAEIGRAMEVATIAECAETDQVVAQLKALPVDFVQGYAVGPPEPLDSLLASAASADAPAA